ncbi:MAG TPA: hypothetical protein VNT75_11155 [Symbiobacteriaceae bacterium]|nr:hypothetical protein [Symbiobacteriaceae bacterium]
MVSQHARKGLTLALGLGFGIGLMAGAVLWSLGAKPDLTDEQVVARARLLGMTRATEMPGAKVTLLVKAEMTVAELADMLKAAGAVSDGEAFTARVKEKFPNGKPKAGVHVVTPGMPLDQLVEALVTSP